MNELFERFDGMIAPVGTGVAKFLEADKNMLSEDTSVLEELLQIGNFGGFPSITIPDGFIDNLPVGLNITGKVKDDELVLNIAYKLESLMDYKNQLSGGNK
jgi:aspartyl-tRNA(Asn)/glutamyl-tRNA(Gln) amidotransferase subunit A